MNQLAGSEAAAAGGMAFVVIIIELLLYVYMALSLMIIANKTNTKNGWLAWIPIANVVLMLMVADKPIWWIILLFIPLVNIIIAILVWMAIAERRGKPGWLGVLMLVPFVNLFIPGYLAFSE